MTTATAVEVASLDSVKELANKWREATGQDIMAAWFPSTPGSSSKCLLARAFNLNCMVFYDSVEAHPEEEEGNYIGRLVPIERDPEGLCWAFVSGSGEIEFELENDAEQFAGVSGYERLGEKTVRLPDEVALVAWEFDNGSYSEYAVEPDKNA
jgi:hypothetical protein